MKKNKKMYYVLLIIALILVILAFTLLEETIILGPVTIVISIYLFLGALIKLCKQNNKLKNTILCTLDLLFWLP